MEVWRVGCGTHGKRTLGFTWWTVGQRTFRINGSKRCEAVRVFGKGLFSIPTNGKPIELMTGSFVGADLFYFIESALLG
jgi:hypothetical protein